MHTMVLIYHSIVSGKSLLEGEKKKKKKDILGKSSLTAASLSRNLADLVTHPILHLGVLVVYLPPSGLRVWHALHPAGDEGIVGCNNHVFGKVFCLVFF